LREEAERRDYEETNLVRLPVMSKKERAKMGMGKPSDGGFGGEEWRGLGQSIDRIGDLTKRKGKDSTLDKSRKRRAVEDGPRSDGTGAAFDVKKRRMQKKG
jgi:U3 small nucleolar ribonucleoprotein protein LCP5